jgi:hypothetical protein
VTAAAPDIDDVLDHLEQLLGVRRFSFTTEAELQRGIAAVLTAADVVFEREVVLARGERIDFLVGALGLEVKVKGTVEAAHMQLLRYAQHERIEGLLLVSGTHKIGDLPPEIEGKPVRVTYVQRAIF